MSLSKQAGLLPALLLTGCASPSVVVAGSSSGNVVDNDLTRSATQISAMQFRLHQSGLFAQRPAAAAGTDASSLLLTHPVIAGTAAGKSSPPRAAATADTTHTYQGVIRQSGGVTPVSLPTTRPNSFHGDKTQGRAAPTGAPSPVMKVWKIDKGMTLRQGYSLWMSKERCSLDKGKWTVRWDTGTDYPIDYALSFSAANLEAATAQLFTLWHHAQVPLFVSGYRQQCLIVVSEGR